MPISEPPFGDETPVTVTQGKLDYLNWRVEAESERLDRLKVWMEGVGGLGMIYGGIMTFSCWSKRHPFGDYGFWTTAALAALCAMLYFKSRRA